MKQKWICLLLLVCMLMPFAALAQETSVTPAEQLLDGDTILYNNDVVKAGIEEAMYGNGDPTNRADVGKYARYVGIGLKSGNSDLEWSNENELMPGIMDTLYDETELPPAPGVTDLSCLQFCTNLTILVINCEEVTGLEVLTKLKSFRALYIKTTKPVDLSILAGIKDLWTLQITQGTNDSYMALADCQNIYTLTFTDCNEVDLLCTFGNKKLRSIEIQRTPVRNFAMLATRNTLQYLTLDDVDIPIPELNAVLAANKKLRSVDLHRMDLQGATGLFDCTAALYMDLDYSQNIPVDPEEWAKLTKLEQLSASYAGLTDCAFVAALPKLSWVDISHNQLTDISALSSLTKMSSVFLNDNQIEDFSPLENLVCEYRYRISNNPGATEDD